MSQEHSRQKQQGTNLKRSLLLLYIALLHIALIATIFISVNNRTLSDNQLNKIVKAEAFKKCISETRDISGCSNAKTWYINNAYKTNDGKILYGNYFGASFQNGFMTYLVVDDEGNVLN